MLSTHALPLYHILVDSGQCDAGEEAEKERRSFALLENTRPTPSLKDGLECCEALGGDCDCEDGCIIGVVNDANRAGTVKLLLLDNRGVAFLSFCFDTLNASISDAFVDASS